MFIRLHKQDKLNVSKARKKLGISASAGQYTSRTGTQNQCLQNNKKYAYTIKCFYQKQHKWQARNLTTRQF